MTNPSGSDDLTSDDQFVERTDNGLRPEDQEFDQPNQDPNTVTPSTVDPQGREVS